MPRPAAKSRDEIAALDCATIRPCDVDGALRCDQYIINVLFNKGQKPFPGFLSGNRVKSYRVPFLEQVGYYTERGEALSPFQTKPSAKP